MIKVDVQLEYISFLKDDVKLKFVFLDLQTKQPAGDFVYNYKNASDYIKLKETFMNFVTEKDFSVSPLCNVVLSTNDVFNTSLILPKAAKSKLKSFIENDLLDKFGPEYKKKYRTTSIVSKYKNDGIVATTSLVSLDLIRRIYDILDNIGLKMNNVTSINMLLHEINGVQAKNEPNKILLYVRDDYTAVNVYYAGALIEKVITKQSYNYLTSLNIVQRRKLIKDLINQVIMLIGKFDIVDPDVEFSDVDLYVNDEVLAHQIKYENPMKFNYNVIQKNDFASGLFKKYNFEQKHLFAKGFTLTEVIVSMAVFSISAAGLITCSVMLSMSSDDDIVRAKAFNKIEQITDVVQNDPANATKDPFNLIYTGDKESGLMHFNSKFEILKTDGTEAAPENTFATMVYTFKRTEDTETDANNNAFVNYVLNIDSVYRIDNDSRLVSNLEVKSTVLEKIVQ